MGQICTTDTEGHENAKRDVIVTSESNKQNRDVTTEAKNEIVEETQEVLEDSKVSDTDVGLKAVDQRTNDVSDDNVIEKTEDVKEDEIVIQQETKETSRTGSTVKWGKDHVILNGSRSLKGAPTLCSLKVKFWCSTTTTNVENCCDFGVHVGTVEGLSSDTSKIYVKVILEDPDGNSPRIKKKTSPKKLTSSVRYDKEITLRKVPQPLVTRGRLLVAVWSKSVKKNKKICDVDIDFGKQIRFGEERSDVMTLSKKITTSQSGVEAILYLC
uniref:C2 domain-containing protein n=2 Tax=Ciona intestinalis TaxID=7719 RepID=F6UG09_CIOIN